MIPVVTVKPLPAGWQVEATGHEPLMFRSGARAERAARRLAEALAEREGAAAVSIYLRGGAFGGRFVFTRSALAPV